MRAMQNLVLRRNIILAALQRARELEHLDRRISYRRIGSLYRLGIRKWRC